MRAGDFRAMTPTSNDCRGEAGTKALKAADSRQQTAQISVLAGHDLRNKFRQNWRNAGETVDQLRPEQKVEARLQQLRDLSSEKVRREN